MPSQGPHQGGFVYNNDHRAPWQQGVPMMDDRFPGQQMPMVPPQFQQNAHIPGYRASNWGPNNFHHPPPFNNYQARFWPRNHNNHNNAGSSRSSSSSPRSSSSSRRGDNESDMCFICKDLLQNCEQLGIHMCDGGVSVKTSKGEHACEINARLEKVLEEIKASLKDKHDSLTEAIEEHVTTRIGEIETIHQHAVDKKATLINLKQQLEARTAELEKLEKELREKENKLEQEKDKFDKDMHKEKEEICRQWQQLRDELARMEEMHDVQKVYHVSKSQIFRKCDNVHLWEYDLNMKEIKPYRVRNVWSFDMYNSSETVSRDLKCCCRSGQYLYIRVSHMMSPTSQHFI